MGTTLRILIIAAITFGVGMLIVPEPAAAQNPQLPDLTSLATKFNNIQWEHGPCQATMRNISQVNVPPGYKFTGETGTATMMELTQNLPRPNDLGLLCPATWNVNNPNENDWFLVFEWDDRGYVKDDDKHLDAAALLTSMRNEQQIANQTLRSRGLPELTLVGWEQPPFYDSQTHLLTWATRCRSSREGMDTVNYNSRILGKGGVLSVNLVIDPRVLQRELPKYKDIVNATTFQVGQRYAEWRAGDKVATYGLAALITTGGAAALAKSGLLAKLGKFVIYIVAGVTAVIVGLFKKLKRRPSTS